MYKCELCSLEYKKFQDKANHVRWHHIGIKDSTKKKISEVSKLTIEKKYGKIIKDKHKCCNPRCSNILDIEYREYRKKEKYYCSRSCSNSRGSMSDEMKKNISNKVKKKWEEGIFDNLNFLKGNTFFSSKNERKIVDYFLKTYPGDLWKSGGGLKYEGIRISRDLYSDKLKTCFEYDGIWHFKDIKGQLENKKKVDRILEEWCIENDYRLIRIQEDFFINMEQIEDLLYKTKEKIIKIGNLY